MRLATIMSLLLLSACNNSDPVGTPCMTSEGCPMLYFCFAGRCEIHVMAPVDLAPPDMDPTLHYPDIQADLKTLTCSQSGCHNAIATNKLQIDLTAGMERRNYDAMIANQMVVPGSPAASPLIVVPMNGTASGGVPHVKILSGAKLAKWTSWVASGAPF